MNFKPVWNEKTSQQDNLTDPVLYPVSFLLNTKTTSELETANASQTNKDTIHGNANLSGKICQMLFKVESQKQVRLFIPRNPFSSQKPLHSIEYQSATDIISFDVFDAFTAALRRNFGFFQKSEKDSNKEELQNGLQKSTNSKSIIRSSKKQISKTLLKDLKNNSVRVLAWVGSDQEVKLVDFKIAEKSASDLGNFQILGEIFRIKALGRSHLLIQTLANEIQIFKTNEADIRRFPDTISKLTSTQLGLVCLRDTINLPRLFFLNNCLVYQNADLTLKFYNLPRFLETVGSLPNEKYLILDRERLDPNKISLKAKANHRDLVCGVRLEPQASFQLRYFLQAAEVVRIQNERHQQNGNHGKNIFKSRIPTKDYGNPDSLYDNNPNEGMGKSRFQKENEHGKDLKSFISQVTCDQNDQHHSQIEQTQKGNQNLPEIDFLVESKSRLVFVDDVYIYKLNNAAKLLQTKKLDYFRSDLILNFETSACANKIYLLNRNENFLYVYSILDLTCMIRLNIGLEIEGCVIGGLSPTSRGCLMSLDKQNKIGLSVLGAVPRMDWLQSLSNVGSEKLEDETSYTTEFLNQKISECVGFNPDPTSSKRNSKKDQNENDLVKGNEHVKKGPSFGDFIEIKSGVQVTGTGLFELTIDIIFKEIENLKTKKKFELSVSLANAELSKRSSEILVSLKDLKLATGPSLTQKLSFTVQNFYQSDHLAAHFQLQIGAQIFDYERELKINVSSFLRFCKVHKHFNSFKTEVTHFQDYSEISCGKDFIIENYLGAWEKRDPEIISKIPGGRRLLVPQIENSDERCLLIDEPGKSTILFNKDNLNIISLFLTCVRYTQKEKSRRSTKSVLEKAKGANSKENPSNARNVNVKDSEHTGKANEKRARSGDNSENSKDSGKDFSKVPTISISGPKDSTIARQKNTVKTKHFPFLSKKSIVSGLVHYFSRIEELETKFDKKLKILKDATQDLRKLDQQLDELATATPDPARLSEVQFLNENYLLFVSHIDQETRQISLQIIESVQKINFLLKEIEYHYRDRERFSWIYNQYLKLETPSNMDELKSRKMVFGLEIYRKILTVLKLERHKMLNSSNFGKNRKKKDLDSNLVLDLQKVHGLVDDCAGQIKQLLGRLFVIQN